MKICEVGLGIMNSCEEGRIARCRDQRRQERCWYRAPHQAFSAFVLWRRLARASRAAPSTMRCNSPGRVLALCVLMSSNGAVKHAPTDTSIWHHTYVDKHLYS